MKSAVYSRIMQLGLLFASAVIHAISWLDERYWVCAWIGLALLFCCLRGMSTWGAIARAFGFGCVMLSVSFYWATDTLTYTLACERDDWLPYFVFVMLVLWEAAPFAVLGYVYVQWDRGKIPLWWTPLFWVPVECFWPRVFPWCFAHSQTGFLSFVQAAELGGAAIVSAIFVAGCVGFSQLVASEEKSFQAEVAEGAELLVCIINGSAFESSTALHQHRRLAQLRSVENRRGFLRCAATGASCYVFPTGEIEQALEHFTEGSFQVTVHRSGQLTIFTTFGYLFPYVCGICLIVLLAWSVLKCWKGPASAFCRCNSPKDHARVTGPTPTTHGQLTTT